MPLPAGDDGNALLTLNCVALGFAILLLILNQLTGTDPFAGFAVFLAACAYLLVELPLGVGTIVYACRMRVGEKRKWFFSVATSAILLGVVALASGWPGR
jgi:hypothetical protein